MTTFRALGVGRPLRTVIAQVAAGYRRRPLALLWRRAKRNRVSRADARRPIIVNQFATTVINPATFPPVAVIGATEPRADAMPGAAPRRLRTIVERVSIGWRTGPERVRSVNGRVKAADPASIARASPPPRLLASFPAAARQGIPFSASTTMTPGAGTGREAAVPRFTRSDGSLARRLPSPFQPLFRSVGKPIAGAGLAAAPPSRRASGTGASSLPRNTPSRAPISAGGTPPRRHAIPRAPRVTDRRDTLPVEAPLVEAVARASRRRRSLDLAMRLPGTAPVVASARTTGTRGEAVSPMVWRTPRPAPPAFAPIMPTIDDARPATMAAASAMARAFTPAPTPTPTSADTGRIVDEVMRRIDQRARGERLRRGI